MKKNFGLFLLALSMALVACGGEDSAKGGAGAPGGKDPGKGGPGGRGAKTLFATHYHELNDMEGLYPRVKNFHIAVKEQGRKVIFLRKDARQEFFSFIVSLRLFVVDFNFRTE